MIGGRMFCKNRMSQEDRQKFKLKMLHRYEDALEVRLAGIKAAKAKLEEQLHRGATDRLHDDMRDNGDS